MPVDGFEVTYAAVEARERRLDGRVFVGVTSTGIYCRPVCPVPKPKREHVRFFPRRRRPSAGFRACRRCRPEASPDSPDWDVRSDLVGRGLRLIAEGVVDREGIDGLAGRLSVGSRHLHRAFVQELGTGPLSVTRSRRAALAKQLLEQTDLLSTDVAFAAGFSSVRSYHDTLRRVYGRTPTEIRGRRPDDVGSEAPELRLAFRPPLAADRLLAFLAARAIPGVESVAGGRYSRAVRSPAGRPVVLEAEPDPFEPVVALRVIGVGDDVPQLAAVVQSVRRLFDLDADPEAIDARLCADPALRRLVRSAPGTRLPGTIDGFELAVERSSASRSRWPAPARPSGASPSGSGRRSVAGGTDRAAVPDGRAARRRSQRWVRHARRAGRRDRGRRPLCGGRIARSLGQRGASRRSGLSRRSAVWGSGPPRTWRCARCATPTRSQRATSGCATGPPRSGLPTMSPRSGIEPSAGDRGGPTRRYTSGTPRGDRRGRLPPVAAQPSVRVAVDGLHPPRWATR